jgi:hypothetical protein
VKHEEQASKLGGAGLPRRRSRAAKKEEQGHQQNKIKKKEKGTRSYLQYQLHLFQNSSNKLNHPKS